MRSLTHAAQVFLALASLLLAPGLARAQSLTVSGTTTLPADTVATYTGITVQSGGVLDIGGGSAITVTGALTVEAGGTILCRSKDITAQVNGAWAGAGVTLRAGSASIAATGRISADGQGYVNGIGPGFPTGLAATTAYRTGASHGGTGSGTGSVAAYGHLLEPATPGQGAAFYDNEQTAGGGAIRLIVDGTLTLDGEITADGTGTAPASGVFHGGATGGSIWVTAGALVGSGRFTADARSAAFNTVVTSYGQSAGGRIAVYAGSDAGFSGWTGTTANAGGGTAQPGSLVIAIGAPGAQALRIAGRADFPQDAILSFESLTLSDDAVASLGGGAVLSLTGALTLGDRATVLCQGKNLATQVDGVWLGRGVVIHAGSVTIPATARISADGAGYRNAVGPGMSPTLAPTSVEARRAGASHGGLGRDGGTNQPVMPVYGSSLEPTTPGQGAGGGATDFVAGGGAIRLVVSGTLRLDGLITANGVSTGSARGGATGGSLWVTAGTLAGSGRFTADAVAGTGTYLGDSGGGRIAVYYAADGGFGGFLTSSVNASSAAGQPGTLAFINTAIAGGGAMRVSQRMTLDDGPVFPLGALTVDNGATLSVAPRVALDIAGTLTVTGNATIQLASADVLAAVDGVWVGSGAHIEAGHVVVAAGSRISVDGEGYRNAVGPGISSTLVPTSVEARRAGASHGGLGRDGGTNQPIMPVYGSSLEPTTPGQGAGGGATDRVAGGGALRLIVDGTLMLDGLISSNGVSVGTARGGATGGSLWVTTGTLAGSGRFSADAVAGTGTYLGVSGGGRIAVYYAADGGFGGFLTSSVNAGAPSGQPGTLMFIDTSVAGNAMRVNQRMTIDAGPIYSLGALTIENGAIVEVAGGVALDIENALTLTGDSTLQLRSTNHLAQVDGGWLGTGATVVAGDVTVAAGSRISVDGEGYRDGNGPGFPTGLPVATDQDTGASYGGRGTGTGALLPYGDPLAPVSLGTGAAIADDEMTAGGGALRLIVHGTLTLDGEISADGIATNPGFQVNHGGASGGSLWVTTDTLTGSGRFSAEGYPGVFINGYKINGNSSGGRAAIYYRSAGGFTGFTDSSAGAPLGNADPGTMLFIQDDGGQLSVRAFERVDVLSDRVLHVHALTLEAGARLDLYGGATLRVAGMLDLKDDVLVNFWSRHRDSSFAGSWIGEGARIDAGDMRVAPTALLTADAQGYRDGMGPGGPNAGDGSHGIGGSYGGKGSGAAAKEPYGSLVAPRDLGSAGGYNRNNAHPNTSTTAGGAIFLNVARSLEFHGIATATGSVRDTTHAGATGGSILVRADRLSGTGRLIADAIGGSGNNQSSGGRIAIWATTNTLPTTSVSARSGGPTAQPGTIHYADEDAIAWIRSPLEVFTGPTRLDWLATGSATTTGIDILARPVTGPALTLATGLAPTASLLWDTTTLEDGLYTLIANKRDTRTGAILGTDTRTVTLLNNALVLRGTITQSVTIPAGRVAFIVGPIVIPAGVTVSAQPGAIVKVSLGASVLVEAGGTLSALGTAEAPIVFTSILDDTIGGDSNFDGAATAPGVVDWNGLRSNGGTISFNEFAEVRHAVEMVDNDITTTVRWRAGSVRVITRQIDIIQGGALTIEPGAIVKFARNTGLRVTAGTLAVEGTLLRPVIFTSEKDDTVGGDSNGDGSLTAPIPGDYYGIQFEDTVSTIRHAEFRYGAESWAGFRGLLDIRTADVRFESCTFVDILFEAAYLQPDQGGTATFENCIFTRVDRPIFANRGSAVVVRNCVFDGNRRAIHISGGRVDVYNSAITNSLDWGVIVDGGSTITDFLNNALWNPRATGGNVAGATITIGASGVIEGDPKFVDRGALDYRVLAGSALIDAGSAAHDTPADFRGFARLGAAPEIGAYEFTAPHSSPVDLQAELSGPPASAQGSATIDLTLVMRNTGTGPVAGPWRHALFLRPVAGGADVPVMESITEPTGTLAAGATRTAALTVTVPDGLVGLYRWGVTVNPREEVFEGANLANNTFVADMPTALDVAELPFGGSVAGRFFRAGESRVFKVRPATPGQTIHVLGDTEPTRGFTQLLAARGRVPSADDFDTQSPQWDQPDATLAIANSADDWYYVRIVASELRVPTTPFTLAARAVEFQLSGLGVTTVGTGPVTVGVLGTDLRQGATVTLRPVGGSSAFNARDVVVTGGTAADASFDLTGAAPGLYDVVVTQGGLERVLPGSLRVSSAATGANIVTTVAGPGVNRVGFPYFAAVTARNTGAADSPAPIITVSGPGMPVDLNDPESPFFGYGYAEDDTGRDFFLAIPPTGNPAILPAGRSAEVFIAQGITPDGRFEVATNIVRVGDTTPYDLAGFGTFLAPSPKPAGWDEVWALLASSEPQTLGGLAHLTAVAADALYRTRGIRSNDVVELLRQYVADVRIGTLSRVSGRVRWADAAELASPAGIGVSLVAMDGTVAAATTTLSDGSFSFPTLAPGVYHWALDQALPAIDLPSLAVEAGTTISGIDLPIVPGATARLRVLPVTGIAFDQVIATLFSNDLGLGSFGFPDALGNVTIRGLVPGPYRLSIHAPGRAPVVREDTSVVAGAVNDLGVFQVGSAGGTIKGRIVRADTQAPVAGVLIAIVGQDRPGCESDADGNFLLTEVPPGTWDLRTRHPGFAAATVSGVVAREGLETTSDIALSSGATLTGIVRDARGVLPNTTVVITAGTTNLALVETAANGEFSISDLPPGDVTVSFQRPGYEPATTTATLASGTSTALAPVTMTEAGRIAGRILSTTGNPVPDVLVRLVHPDGRSAVSLSNAAGRFGFARMPAATYELGLTDGASRQAVVVGTGGGVLAEVALTLDVGTVTGRITPPPGRRSEVSAVMLLRDGHPVATTTTDRDGTFAFRQVRAGDYTCIARNPDSDFGPLPVVVSANTTTDLGALAMPSGSIAVSIASRPDRGRTIDLVASVTLVRRLDDHREFSRRVSTMSTSGVLEMERLAPGRYWLLAETVYGSSGWQPVDVATGRTVAPVALLTCGYVMGTVTTSGDPVEGAVLTFVSTTNRQMTHEAMTGARGQYLAQLPLGTYELWAGAPFREPGLAARLVGTVNVTSFERVTTNVALGAASTRTITGRVVADAQSFPEDGLVRLLSPDGAELAAASIGKTGAYSLPLPAAGTYRVVATAGSYQSAGVNVVVSTASVANVDITVPWCGGLTQPLPPRVSRSGPAPARAFSVASAAKSGAPRPMFWEEAEVVWSEIGEQAEALKAGYESFRTWVAEEIFARPPELAPTRSIVGLDLYNEDCPCPTAAETFRKMLAAQKAAAQAHADWVNTWDGQVTKIADLTRDFGVNLGKVALTLATAGFGSQADEAFAAANEARQAYNAVGNSYDRANAALTAAQKTNDFPVDELLALNRLEYDLSDAYADVQSAQGVLRAANQALANLGLGLTAGAGAIQLTGSDAVGGNPISGLAKVLYDLPAAMSSVDSIKTSFDNLVGTLQTLEQLNILLNDPKYKANPILGKLGAIGDAISAITSTGKLLAGLMENMYILEASEERYLDQVDRRDRLYEQGLSQLADCRSNCPPPEPPGQPKPPKPPGGPDGGNGSGRGDRAHDPNAKYTIGYGEAGYVRPDEPLIYTITFENIAEAGLPAQRVIITDQLSDRLDWSTFELLAAGFNRTSFAIPPGLQRHTRLASVATDPNPVKCDFRLNPATGLFTIDLRSVDAVTGGFPRNSLSGFLPPNDNQHRGEGFVTFMIKPMPGQADGTEIRNIASIVFDTNEAIITNESVNTLDATPPQGRVTTLARRSGNNFLVSWSGNDQGSGAVAYDVWVSRNNGPWELWQRDVAATSATFAGVSGSTYRFFATARDGVGWSDAPRFAPDTSTLVGLGSRLVNISTRGLNGTGSNAMIVGFVVEPGAHATTPKNLLLRGVGPGLNRFNVPGTLADPRLDLHNAAGAQVTGNEDWSDGTGAAQLPAEFSRLRAFSLPAASKDAALRLGLAPALYTARVTGANDTTGVTLVEAYDADASFSDDTLPRLINLSTRGYVGTADQQLIAGFVISGDTPKILLIRAVGPTLGAAPFNVPGVLGDPHIRLVDGAGTTVFENDDWSNSPDPALITEVSRREGAFGLPSGSKDAVMVVTLPPGSYTAMVTGRDGGTGVAIVELYDAD